MSKKRVIIIFCLIFLIGIFFRLYKISSVPVALYQDEAMNGNNAMAALATGNFKVFYPENNGREGLLINLQTIAIAFFGNQIFSLRIVAALFGIFTILAIYLLAKEIFFQYPAAAYISLCSAFFLATSYWNVNFSRLGLRAITMPFFCCFSLYFLWRGWRAEKNEQFYLGWHI